jgi:MFS family permease
VKNIQATTAVNSGLQRQNDRNLYFDIFWWGILAGTLISFLGIYLARLGASSYQLSILTAGPAVVNLFMSLPAGKWLENRSFTRTAYISSILHRAGYILILLVMFIFAGKIQISVILWATVMMSVPGAVLMIVFNAMFAEIVPPERRGLVVGRRNALLAVSMTTSSLISGYLLEHFVFPFNYQIVFLIGIIGGALSCYYLGRIRKLPGSPSPTRVGKPLLDRARPGMVTSPFARRYIPGMRFLTRGVEMVRFDVLRGEFGFFLGAMLYFYISQYLVIPLFPTYSVDTMGLSDWVISIGTAIFQTAVFISSLRLGWISDRMGHQRLMIVSVLGFAGFPLCIGLLPNVNGYMLGCVIGGTGWGFLGGAVTNRLMERAPEDDRPAHMALFNLTLNLGVLVGSLLSPVLGDWTGLQAAMVIGGMVRILAAVILWRWG